MVALSIALIFFAGLLPVGSALGEIQRPEVKGSSELAHPHRGSPAKFRQISSTSYVTRLRRDLLAKLRPVEQQRDGGIDFEQAQRTLLTMKTTQEKIFSGDFERKMRDQYAARVAPFEQTANDPVWRARYWETARYEDGRKDLARWTTREVLDDQLKEFFHGGDQSSAPMQVLSVARSLSGGGDEAPANADAALTPEQKIARAHRKDLPPVKEEEERIPTKLKTKINVIKAQGSIVFSNPVAITSVNGDRDDLSIGMNRDFRKISLSSNLSYGVGQECLNLNVNKRITDRVSLDLSHASYTGGKRGSTGEKTREQARVNYSMSF
jgi:hypothetical protein